MAIQAHISPNNLGLPLLGLGSSQDRLMMDLLNSDVANNNHLLNSCGFNEFSFSHQEKLQLQQQFEFQYQFQQQQQRLLQFQNLQQKNNPSLCSDNGYIFSPPSSKDFNDPVNLLHCLTSQIENQRLEIDRYISLENERLKLVLQEQRGQQVAAMLNKAEEKIAHLLSKKDEEIAKARKRTMELEELTWKMDAEIRSWQKIAAEKEAMVVCLSNQLEELKEQACCVTSSYGLEDAESCFNGDYENPRNRGIVQEQEEEIKKMMIRCRKCDSRNACMLFLPCRHLCSCKDCEAFLDSCPVCKSAKRATIEALIS